MRLIFLDVDGVLNNTQNIKKYRLFFRGKRRLLIDIKPFFCLKKLLEEIEKNKMDVRIVISSSWRVGSIAFDWKKLFLHYFNNAEIVKGRTPYLYKDRGIEILELIEIAKEKLSIDLNLPGPPNVHRYDYDEKRTPVYVITIVYYNGFGRTISIDANTGEILFDKEIGGGDEFIIEYNSEDHYINEYYPLKKKRTSKSKTTKTPKTTSFNGKTYTEEEWKAFEQEQWEKYQANKNHKSFWDKLFG